MSVPKEKEFVFPHQDFYFPDQGVHFPHQDVYIHITVTFAVVSQEDNNCILTIP